MGLNITHETVTRLHEEATRSFEKGRHGEDRQAVAHRSYASGMLEVLRELGLIEE